MTLTVELVIEKSVRIQYVKSLRVFLSNDDAKELEGHFYFNVIETFPKDQSLVLLNACYKDRMNDLLRNIDPKWQKKKNNFLERIESGEVKLGDISTMYPSEIHPKMWKKEIDRAEKARDLLKNGARTEKFQCPKCKQHGHRISQEQTRSADEPMTIFLTCLNAGCEYVMKK
jgi:DNA-directed RNA polymerase subunit M/transcription elongation factor TFIIS